MGQRLLRTRNKIAHTGIRFAVPEPHRIGERTAGVLAVVYLIFNQGYGTPGGDGTGEDLAAEAIRLADLLTQLQPDDDEVQGLDALLLLQHARRVTRVDADGELEPMQTQDRSRWDRSMVLRGLAALMAARESGRPAGPYRLQAEIAAEHATAATAAATDWARIVAAYDALFQVQPSPVVGLNRAVALGFRDGPDSGLAALAALQDDGRLAGYHLLPAVRADLLRRAGRRSEAADAYQEALRLVRTAPERRFLERRVLELAAET
jgi:RNA polymerase sigma-70 factor (ECF subfamily)